MSPIEMPEENGSEPEHHRERNNNDNENQDEIEMQSLLNDDQNSPNESEVLSEQPETESDEGVRNSTEGNR